MVIQGIGVFVLFSRCIYVHDFRDGYVFMIITPYIRMLDSDWLIAVIIFLQIQALHCEFAEFLLHVGVFA